MPHLKWSFGDRNTSNTRKAIFGIPALRSKSGFVTCPGAGACAAVCYARSGFYYMPAVQNAKEFNLKQTRNLKSFVLKAVEDIRSFRVDVIRVHDAGDFYSQDYLNAWFEIARQVTDKTFYAYTKSLHLDFSARPRNFKVVRSEGGKWDHKIDKRTQHSRIFASKEAMEKAGYTDGNNPNVPEPALTGLRKIGLVYHGQKRLTEPQEEYFG